MNRTLTSFALAFASTAVTTAAQTTSVPEPTPAEQRGAETARARARVLIAELRDPTSTASAEVMAAIEDERLPGNIRWELAEAAFAKPVPGGGAGVVARLLARVAAIPAKEDARLLPGAVAAANGALRGLAKRGGLDPADLAHSSRRALVDALGARLDTPAGVLAELPSIIESDAGDPAWKASAAHRLLEAPAACRAVGPWGALRLGSLLSSEAAGLLIARIDPVASGGDYVQSQTMLALAASGDPVAATALERARLAYSSMQSQEGKIQRMNSSLAETFGLAAELNRLVRGGDAERLLSWAASGPRSTDVWLNAWAFELAMRKGYSREAVREALFGVRSRVYDQARAANAARAGGGASAVGGVAAMYLRPLQEAGERHGYLTVGELVPLNAPARR